MGKFKSFGRVFLLLALSVAACATDDEKQVVKIASVDISTVKLDFGAKVELVKDSAGPSLRLTTPPSDTTPGFELAVPPGSQDLSSNTQIFLHVKNAGPGEATVSCRAENPDAAGVENCTEGSLSLAPGQSGTLRVNIRRKKPDWVKVDLFGMRGYPWSGPLGIVNLPRHLIDPAHVVKLVIFTRRPREEQVFEVSRILAVGKFDPPSPLLADSAKFFPFNDQFGQYMHADWPGKIHSAEELTGAVQTEEKDIAAHPGPQDRNQYGGWKDGPKLEATGFFYPAKYEGKWWLVDPEGNLFFSHGIDCVNIGGDDTPVTEREKWFKDLPPRDSEFRDCYRQSWPAVHGYYKDKASLSFDFSQANLIRKYGADWQERFVQVTHRRLRSWGLNTIGCWSSPGIYQLKKTPYVGTIDFHSKPLEGSQGYWGKFRDVFDPAFRANVRSAVERLSGTTALDPWCIGYFVDNEISWGNDDKALALGTLASPAGQIAKQTFVEDLKARYGEIRNLNTTWGTDHASWEALLQSTATPDTAKAHDDLVAFTDRTARTYFQTIREAMKEVCPNQLYLGCRFAWVNPAVVRPRRSSAMWSATTFTSSISAASNFP